MSKSLLTTRELALIGLMTAVTCIISPMALPIPISPVPVTFGNLALFLAVYVLGMKNGFISLSLIHISLLLFRFLLQDSTPRYSLPALSPRLMRLPSSQM